MKKVKEKSVSYNEGLERRLKNPAYASEYLMTCLEDREGDSEELFLMALRDIAKAHGFQWIAKRTQLGRESLYKAISEKGNPTLSTLTSILDAMGLRISIKPRRKAA